MEKLKSIAAESIVWILYGALLLTGYGILSDIGDYIHSGHW